MDIKMFMFRDIVQQMCSELETQKAILHPSDSAEPAKLSDSV